MPLKRSWSTWKAKLFFGSLFFHRLIAKKTANADICSCKAGFDNYNPRGITLELMSREIYRYKIEGSCAEVGVYRGDFAKQINYYFPDRKLYLFDTFEGFDKKDADIDRKKSFSSAVQDWSKTSEELVLSKMEHKENCIIKKGWFPDTAEGIDDKFCFVSLDPDLYQPTKAGLEFFYPRLVNGGVIMIHDFINKEYNGVREAVKEFCVKNNTGYVLISDIMTSAVIVR